MSGPEPDTRDDRLRLVALDTDDLAVLSALVQDAVLKAGDMSWLAQEKRFYNDSGKFLVRNDRRAATEAALFFDRPRRQPRQDAALKGERHESVDAHLAGPSIRKDLKRVWEAAAQ